MGTVNTPNSFVPGDTIYKVRGGLSGRMKNKTMLAKDCRDFIYLSCFISLDKRSEAERLSMNSFTDASLSFFRSYRMTM